MTEKAKQCPQNGEWWWVYLFEETNPSIAQHTKDEYGPGWYLSGDDWILRLASATPIAPVASHELVAELIAALTMTEHLYQRGILFVDKAIYYEVHNSRKSILAWAKRAGLGE